MVFESFAFTEWNSANFIMVLLAMLLSVLFFTAEHNRRVSAMLRKYHNLIAVLCIAGIACIVIYLVIRIIFTFAYITKDLFWGFGWSSLIWWSLIFIIGIIIWIKQHKQKNNDVVKKHITNSQN
jgi:hypothetical protein